MDEQIKNMPLQIDFTKEIDFESIENKQEKESLIKQYLLNLANLTFSNYKMLIQTLKYSYLCQDIKEEDFIFDPQFAEVVKYIKSISDYAKLDENIQKELEVFFERQLSNSPDKSTGIIDEQEYLRLEGEEFFNNLYIETQNRKKVTISEETVEKLVKELSTIEKESPEFSLKIVDIIYEMFSEEYYQEALQYVLNNDFVQKIILEGISYQITTIKKEQDVQNAKSNIGLLIYEKEIIKKLYQEINTKTQETKK
jgi:hypothetical protein